MSERRKSAEEVKTQLRKYLKATFILSVLGLLTSIWLLYVHASGADQPPGCSISGTINCDILQLKTYSEWFGVPIPIYSILFYVLLTLIVRDAQKTADPKRVRPFAYMYLFALVSVLTTFYMAYVALVLLGSICPFCFVLYIISFGILFCTWKMITAVDEPWWYLIKQDIRIGNKSPWFYGTLIAVAIVLPSSHFLLKARGTKTGDPFDIKVEEKRTLGLVSSPIEIVEFSDFQCPYCKVAGGILKQVEAELRGKVKIVYKFYPLDQACNSSIKRKMHVDACRAAEAAFCASLQSKFWSYHDLLFTSQDSLPRKLLYEFAKEAELNLSDFDMCMNDERSRKAVWDDVREGNRYQVSGTPTIFINGQRYTGAITVSSIKEAALN